MTGVNDNFNMSILTEDLHTIKDNIIDLISDFKTGLQSIKNKNKELEQKITFYQQIWA